MKALIISTLLLSASLFLSSCSRTLTPSKVNSILPSMTQSSYMTQAEANEAVKAGKCSYLVTERTYVAPNKMTAKGDLKAGAQGIDEWVTLDSGNAYLITNYNWMTTDNATTQLHITFDTMLCL